MWTLLLASAVQASDWDHDYAELTAFYADAVDTRGVDYPTLTTRRARLDGWVSAASTAPVTSFDPDQALAFWINAYNALTVQLVLDAGPPASIMALDGGKVWTTRRFTVGGRSMTLDELENLEIRKRGDGRIHAAVNCAARGCSPLPPVPVKPASLQADLDAAARRWVQTNAFAIVADEVRLSRIFEWYAADFPTDPKVDVSGVDAPFEGALQAIARHAEPTVAERLLSGALRPAWSEYDWALNQR